MAGFVFFTQIWDCSVDTELMMFGRFAHYRTATMLRMTRTLPCCGYAFMYRCLAMFGWPAPVFRYQALRSPPVSVFSTFVVHTRRARGRGWATHGLLTEVSTGVPWVLTGTHPCDAPPRQGGGTSERQLVPCWSVCCGARTRSVKCAAVYVLYCVLSQMNRNNCAKNSFNRIPIGIEVHR